MTPALPTETNWRGALPGGMAQSEAEPTRQPATRPASGGPLPQRPRSGRVVAAGAAEALPAVDAQRADALLREAHLQLLAARQRCAEAEAAGQRQSAFLVLLAHELRVPLAPIRHAAALLGRPGAAEMLPRLQQVIERQLDHATRLIEDLLDAARLRTGKLTLQRRRVDLHDIVATAVQAQQPGVDQRAQSLLVELPPARLPLDADPVRLAQVLSNLLGNAVKFTPVGGHIWLTVTCADGCATISVVDTGIGINAGALAQVFEPYVQEPHAVGYDPSGLGLGLSVARDLVIAHGGHIVARSDGLGCGSRFDVTMALAEDGPCPVE